MLEILSKEIFPGIKIYSNVFPEAMDFIQEIEDFAKNRDIFWGFGVSTDLDGNKILNFKLRNVLQVEIPYDNFEGKEFLREYSERLKKIFEVYENDYKEEYPFNTSTHERFLILKYKKGQYSKDHTDDQTFTPRRISSIYYPNDDYTGGELEFAKFDISIKPKAGDLIIFPSNYVYAHRVLPVTEGIRYAIISFIA